MRKQHNDLMAAGVITLLLAGGGCTQPKPQPQTAESNHHDGHHRFQDVEKWAGRFENPDRDTWQKPDHVMEVLGLASDAKVADIGSATGYFPVRFAKAAPDGMVYGIDIEPDMVAYLNDRAAREGLTNLKSLLGKPNDPRIPEPVDVVFICDTYHHIDNRQDYFSRLRKKLRPGGRLVIVDFIKKELPIGPPPKHKLSADEVCRELQSAGYRLVRRDETLPYQYILVFQPQR